MIGSPGCLASEEAESSREGLLHAKRLSKRMLQIRGSPAEPCKRRTAVSLSTGRDKAPAHPLCREWCWQINCSLSTCSSAEGGGHSQASQHRGAPWLALVVCTPTRECTAAKGAAVVADHRPHPHATGILAVWTKTPFAQLHAQKLCPCNGLRTCIPRSRRC